MVKQVKKTFTNNINLWRAPAGVKKVHLAGFCGGGGGGAGQTGLSITGGGGGGLGGGGGGGSLLNYAEVVVVPNKLYRIIVGAGGTGGSGGGVSNPGVSGGNTMFQSIDGYATGKVATNGTTTLTGTNTVFTAQLKIGDQFYLSGTTATIRTVISITSDTLLTMDISAATLANQFMTIFSVKAMFLGASGGDSGGANGPAVLASGTIPIAAIQGGAPFTQNNLNIPSIASFFSGGGSTGSSGIRSLNSNYTNGFVGVTGAGGGTGGGGGGAGPLGSGASGGGGGASGIGGVGDGAAAGGTAIANSIAGSGGNAANNTGAGGGGGGGGKNGTTIGTLSEGGNAGNGGSGLLTLMWIE